MLNKLLTTATIAGLSVSVNAATVTFDDNALAPNSFFSPNANTTFTSGGVTFDHTWNDTYNCCWGNFTYSNNTDTTTPGFTNDRSAITGGGAGGSANYGVTYSSGAYINFGGATVVNSIEVTNTTYAYLAVKDGNDGNDPAFVKGPFEAGDFFRVTVSELGNATNSVEFSLAEGTDVLDTWMTVDLSALGAVNGIAFSYDSSDPSPWGLNTPTYFAIDNIEYSAVPVPAAAWLFGSALVGLGVVRRKA